MKIALLSTDDRENKRHYARENPIVPTPQEALLQGFAGLPDNEIHFISCVKQPVNSPVKLGPRVYYHSLVVPKIGWMRTGYQGCIRAVRKKLREIQPDIVHGQGTERDCAISAVFSGYPNVVTIHGNMRAIAEFYHGRPGSYYWITARLEDFVLRRTGGVFCNSAYTEKLVSPRAARTWRVANALRADFFSPPSNVPVAPVPVLLNIGATEPRKRQLELLALACRLHQRGLKFQLQFAGHVPEQTPYGAAFITELRRAEHAGYARHLGSLSSTQLVSALDAASALVHFPAEEAFGLVVAEALARNVKLFGAATGGVVDISTGVDGAEIIEVQNIPALEESIVNWLNAGAPKPGGAASVMRDRYHPQVIARRHLEIYREVLGQSSGAKNPTVR